MKKLIPLTMIIILSLVACGDEQPKDSQASKKLEQNQEQGALERAKQYPAPIESIIDQGVEIIDTFEAPGGMMVSAAEMPPPMVGTGFVGSNV